MATFNSPVIRGLLIDISGTLLIGSSPIPGAAHALATLRTARIPFRLCSNTSKESSNAVHERMRATGLDVRREEVWTSVGALRAVLKQLGVKRPFTLLSRSALEECTDNPEMEDGDELGVVPGNDPASSVLYDAVIVGLAPPLLDYAHLNTAFRILAGENQPRDLPRSQPGTSATLTSNSDMNGHGHRHAQPHHPPLIVLHKARYLEAADHALSLGPGPFIHALEEAAQTSAIVVGKPTRAFFETVLRDLDRDLGLGRDHPGQQSPHSGRWEEVAVIGDDVLADLGEGAIELGLWRVLVKTGKYRPGDEERKDALPPDEVCASFAEFVEMLVEQHRS